MELDRLEQIFGRDNTYVELQNAHLDVQQPVFEALPKLAAARGLPLVATGDVHYLDATDAYPHEALLCIQSGDWLENPNHWKFGTNEFYFKAPDEMALDFPGHEDALRRTLEVAERCNVEIALDRILLPTFPTPGGRDAFEYLVELCEAGLSKRYDRVTPELTERLQFELKTVREMGFADYFLIVADFIGFAKNDGVSVGPGRGSAAGSLAAYALGITDIDPMRYGLLFERFLNPARKDMPDMDIDFAVEGRERVINYVAEKYGRDRVAQIITFSTMAARAAVRDAGRVLEIPVYGTVDRLAKMIPEGPGKTLDEALKPGGELANAVKDDPVAREIVDLARPLEGLTRADSIHAAGVVIGAQPLIEVVPLQQKGADQEVVTQVSMKNVEALGLLKMDFLGLRNLDVIDKAVALIGNGLDIGKIPIDDARTYAMLARADSIGVFQFESSGMREALRHVKPTEFEDLIALVALYRPGPMQYIPSYAARKNGREAITYIDERLRAITGDSQGICIYQEQYMQIAKLLAGFSPAEAETLRRAIGKKIHALMAVSEAEVPRRLRCQQRHSRRREPALEGHGVVAGLLVQQGPRCMLCTDCLPHRLAQGQPPLRVHGGADLLGHEHEGPRPAVRERLRRDGDRGAAARRERVGHRLRGGRGKDPLRPERGQERRRQRRPLDHLRAEGGRAVRDDLGLHRARRPAARQQARARVSRRSAERSTRPAPRGWGCSACSSRRSPTGRSSRPTDSPARARSSTSASAGWRRRSWRRSTIPPSLPPSSRSPSSCGWRRRRSACTSPSTRSAPSATSCAARPTRPWPSSSGAATAKS